MSDRRGGASSGGGVRGDLKQRVKTGRGRTLSQKRWLERQLNDPYVARAKREGYRSRAAYKLIEIDERYKLLRPGQRVVDLGAAPGGWSQVAARTWSARRDGSWASISWRSSRWPGSSSSRWISSIPRRRPKLTAMLGGPADLVLSDMAANATGHKKTDHLRIIGLAETAAEFAREILGTGGRLPRQGVPGRHGGRAADRPEARLHHRPPRQAGREPRRFQRTLRPGDGLPRRPRPGRRHTERRTEPVGDAGRVGALAGQSRAAAPAPARLCPPERPAPCPVPPLSRVLGAASRTGAERRRRRGRSDRAAPPRGRARVGAPRGRAPRNTRPACSSRVTLVDAVHPWPARLAARRSR